MVEHPTNWSNFETGICLDARDLSLVDMLHSDSLKDFACLTWALSLYLLPMSLESAVWFGQIPNLWQDSQPPPLGNSCPFPRSCGMNGHPGWKVSKILFFKTWLWSHKRRAASSDGGSSIQPPCSQPAICRHPGEVQIASDQRVWYALPRALQACDRILGISRFFLDLKLESILSMMISYPSGN